jgi:hypothetical protein
MSTNLNFTGRIDLVPSQVSFGVVETDQTAQVRVTWDLSGLGLPKSAMLRLKATSIFDTKVYEMGNLDSETGSDVFDIKVIRNYASADFTFQVLEPDQNGIPLIKANRKGKAETLNGVDTPQSSLLETRSNSDIKQAWKVTIEDGRPILDIASDLHQDLLSSQFFDPLVIPAVLERILEWLIWTQEKNLEVADKWEEFFVTHGVQRQLFEDFMDNSDLTFESLKDARVLISSGAGEVAQYLKANDMLRKLFED